MLSQAKPVKIKITQPELSAMQSPEFGGVALIFL
jgi:hypothetical protein